MTVSLGAHIGQQNLTIDELRTLWRELDQAGLDWLSLWDHLYEAPPAGGTIDHFEAVAALGAMAVDTTNARLGCLVFAVGYRNPALLAKSAVTLQHLSGGRFELGLGGGWHVWEAEAYGYEFGSVGTRLSMLDEGARLISSLFALEDERSSGGEIGRLTLDGQYFQTADASFLPAPVDGKLRLWIGGLGEQKTLRTAAAVADGWNAAYVTAADFGAKSKVLDERCEEIDRDPAEIERSVNLAFYLASDDAGARRAAKTLDTDWGPQAPRISGGALLGTPDQALDAVMGYVEAGADLVNVALRAPFDRDALDAYVNDVVPAIRAEA